jgi:hypothetical protein
VSGRTRRTIAAKCLAMIGAVAFVAGCGGTYDASVSGVVSLNQAPLPGGTVKFTPESPGPSGYGLIDSSGNYQIMTGREAGLPAGKYVATVVANEPSIPNKNPSLPPAPGKPITPAWYRDPVRSPLKYTVEPGSNEINMELSTQPPAGWNPRGR